MGFVWHPRRNCRTKRPAIAIAEDKPAAITREEEQRRTEDVFEKYLFLESNFLAKTSSVL